jgi:amino acid adenylation domain-containing protein
MANRSLGISRPAHTASTLVALLRNRALQDADHTAYSFLVDGETEAVSLTYAELDRRARAIAATLQTQMASGERALLLYPPGLDYIAGFFGCLYAGIVAVPAYPPRSDRMLPHLQSIAADVRPAAILTTTALHSTLDRLVPAGASLGAPRWLDTTHLEQGSEAGWQEPRIGDSSLAFIQYTSGSTRTPKGVMLSHGNLLHNQALIQRAFGHTERTIVVGWLPLYHDMGLIGNVLQPLFLGIPCILMSPLHFLQRPIRWLQAISRSRATSSGGPNFAYELCVRKIPPEQRATLDLSSWQVAFNGAEPVQAGTLDRFSTAFECAGFRREAFYPCYGLAEATLLVAGRGRHALPIIRIFATTSLTDGQAREIDFSGAEVRPLVGYDSTLLDQHVLIVQPEATTTCSPGQIGEIWVSGPSVAQGYWGRPEETAATFHAGLVDTGAGPFLRTGDLGFLHDGALFVTGRLKDLIIIRGRNHYPQDIELTVEQSHPSLRAGCGAAFTVEADGEERLVVVQEVERQYRRLDGDAVAGAIRRAVAEQHEVQVYAVVLIKTGGIAKTTSGKIKRHDCRAQFLAGSLDVIASNILAAPPFMGDEADLTCDALLRLEPRVRQPVLAAYLQEQVARVLNVTTSGLELQQPINRLGLDSLMAIELQHSLEAHLGVVVPMVTFLQDRSINQLASEILTWLAAPSSAQSGVPALQPHVVVERALSHGQRALWFLHQLGISSAAYTIARAVRIRAELNTRALQRAFQHLVERHPALRTTFTTRQGEPVQQVQAQGDVWFQVEDASNWSDARFQEHFIMEAQRPFDLERDPLVRCCLFTCSEREHVLLLVVHHLVADLWSLVVMLRDLEMLYSAEKRGCPAPLAPLQLHYTDYVRWQADMHAGPEGERLWAFWQRQLAGELPVLNMPIDRPRPPVVTYCGATHSFRLSDRLTGQIKALAQAAGTTLYTTLLAAFQVLLYHYTGQEEILVGTPTAGRDRAGLVDLVGYFVNPLVLRADLAGNPPFNAFLEQTRQTVLAAFAHQDYPFALLVERLQPKRDPSRSPLFQIMFSLQRAHLLADANLSAFILSEASARMTLGELEIEVFPFEQRVAQFDLTLTMAEVAGGLTGAFQYNTDLFDATTIARMAGHLQTLLAGIAANPACPVAHLPLITDAERRQLLNEWNTTSATYPGYRCLHQLFEAQVARTPNAIAVVWDDQQLSYAALNRRANQLAHYLRALGVGPEMCVGVCVERSPEMLVGVLGILKAGGAYLPLDPTYPPQRLASLLADAGAPILTTQRRLAGELRPYVGREVCLDSDWELIAQECAENPDGGATPEHLAYVIYTSGSTGIPNGVQVSHRALVNFLLAMCQRPGLSDQDVLLSVTTLAFDIAALELFLPLTTGARLVLASRDVAQDGRRLAAALNAAGTTIMQATPATWRLLMEASWPGAPGLTILCGGETLPRELANQLGKRCAALWNMYGPTETTIWSIMARIEVADGPVPIGRPIANTQIYLLDRQLRPVPVGVPGEVYIGGAGLARGYLNRPDLTAERFIPNPFSAEAGTRLYKTGDLARFRPDGAIEYLGRIDHQIKLRGFRIEIGEIEALLAQHPAVRQSVVVAREDIPGEKRLVAYVVPSPLSVVSRQLSESGDGWRDKGQWAMDNGQRSSELRSFLKAQLPEYMIPAAIVFLADMPLTASGKVDRRALPAPLGLAGELETAFVPPTSEAERILAAIWREVLKVDEIGVHENFFDLGGHSLLLAQVQGRLHDAWNRDIRILDLFRYPTIHSLAHYLAQEQPSPPSLQQSQKRAEIRRGLRGRQQKLKQRRQATRSPQEVADE